MKIINVDKENGFVEIEETFPILPIQPRTIKKKVTKEIALKQQEMLLKQQELIGKRIADNEEILKALE